ncbi:hypothetical protein [Bauldia sp.]|uniref:hypothetical protein n=1 Tax=Bauldia sp. TaxID=2575872 RepID=UPI003BA87480
MKKVVEHFVGGSPFGVFASAVADPEPGYVKPTTVVLENDGHKIVLTGSFISGINGPIGTVNEFTLFDGATKIMTGKGFNFTLADIADAKLADHPTQVLADLFYAKADKVIGSSQSDHLTTSDNGGVILGRGGNDYMVGGSGKQTLKGGGGDDAVHGGKGKDIAIGGKGKDTFVFDDEAFKTDKIKDFSHKDDTIYLADIAFDVLPGGALKKKFFNVGKKAEDDNDHIVYFKKNGGVFYDPDGEGGIDQVKFASVKDGTKLKANDFFVDTIA